MASSKPPLTGREDSGANRSLLLSLPAPTPGNCVPMASPPCVTQFPSRHGWHERSHPWSVLWLESPISW